MGPKLRWLRNNLPGFRPTNRWHSAHTYVVERLTAAWVMDHHMASQCDPLHDIAAHGWDRDWAHATVPVLALPQLR